MYLQIKKELSRSRISKIIVLQHTQRHRQTDIQTTNEGNLKHYKAT